MDMIIWPAPPLLKPAAVYEQNSLKCTWSVFCPHSVSNSAEPIIVEVTFRNPLKVSLALSKLSLLWRFTPDSKSPSEEKTTEELAAETIANAETLALGVGRFYLRNCDF